MRTSLENTTRPSGRVCAFISAVIFIGLGPPRGEADVVFVYPPLETPILSASFEVDLAALWAHRYVGDVETNSLVEVNYLKIVGAEGFEMDLSKDLFGETVFGIDRPEMDLEPLETRIVSVEIKESFLPVLAGGRIGLQGTITDTDDALFAIDYFALNIAYKGEGADPTKVFIDENDGFGYDLIDRDPLDFELGSPDQEDIPLGVDGNGFDSIISSASYFGEGVGVPEPSTAFLLLVGLFGVLGIRRHDGKPIVYSARITRNG